MSIKTYKKGDSTQIATNFKAIEFDCEGKGCCSQTPIDMLLVDYLQKIRNYFNKPVILTAYRCPTHNAKVPNASKTSYHMYGQAADFHINGVEPAEIAKYAETLGIKGIGLYDSQSDGHFVHIDTRTTKSFWIGHAQKRVTTFGGNPPKEVETIEVDGSWGQQTTRVTQMVLGTTVDGIVSNQSTKQQKYLPNANTSSWKFKESDYENGSSMIKAIQKLIGATQDGICGYNTIVAMQKFLKKNHFFEGNVDGIMGKKTVTAWQNYINSRVQ